MKHRTQNLKRPPPAVLLFSLLSFLFSAFAATGESLNTNPLSATVRLQPSTVSPGQTAQILFDLKLDGDYHAYADKFKIAIDQPDDLKVGDFKVGPLVKFTDAVSKKQRDGIEKKATARAPFEVPQGFKTGHVSAKVKLTYQACAKENCLFPKTITLDLPFNVVPNVN